MWAGSDCFIPRRRDANLLPRVTRVDNPYAIPETPADIGSNGRTSRKPAMPSEEWRSIVGERFENLKKVCFKSYFRGPPDLQHVRIWHNRQSMFKLLFR